MRLAYIRVSTDDQNLARQIEAMKEQNIDKTFQDIQSGKDANRKGLQELLAFAREGDIIVIESYSRLARSTSDLLKIVNELKNKKISLISLKENIDTSTPQGEFILTVFAGLYQFERQCNLQRQREGIEIAKREGKYKGRQPIDIDADLFYVTYTNWRSGLITAKKAMNLLGLTPNTFYRIVKEYETGNVNTKRAALTKIVNKKT